MKPTPLAFAATFSVIALCLAPPVRAGATVTEPLTVREPEAAAPAADDSVVKLEKHRVSGPRVGFTVAPIDDASAAALEANGMGRVVSQFGWHFERQIVPAEGGPVLLTQFVPLVGGVEYGKLIPTLTFALGVRLPSGTEFGVGPSFTLANSEGKATSGLMLAVGRSLPYGGVSIPLNLAVSLNRDGTRVTMLAGYAIRQGGR